MKRTIERREFEGERPLFMLKDSILNEVTFNFGESPLKESANLEIYNSTFTYKYPIWYSNNIYVNKCHFLEMARSGVRYTNFITIDESIFDCPKIFRHASHVTVNNSKLLNADESFWFSNEINVSNCEAKGDYMFMQCNNLVVTNLRLDGNYCFDGAKNIIVKDCILNSKDSFWNTENVYIENSTIIGEYFGRNSKNITLKNCIIDSNQGFCYIENLRLIDCKLENTDLAFEYSSIEADIIGDVVSIKNPLFGYINCDSVKEIIIDENCKKPCRTQIFQRKLEKNE